MDLFQPFNHALVVPFYIRRTHIKCKTVFKVVRLCRLKLSLPNIRVDVTTRMFLICFSEIQFYEI